MPAPAQVGSPSVQQAPVTPANQRVNPFRVATVERNEIIFTTTKALTTGTQQNVNPIIGTGFYRSVYLKVQAVHPSNNSANVAYNEDAPYNGVGQIVFHDVNGDLINLSQGFHARELGRYTRLSEFPTGKLVLNGNGAIATNTALTPDRTNPSDTLNVYQAVNSTGNSGGDFLFWLELPAAINERDLIGLLGNQDRAQTYTIRSDYAPSTNIYSTGPTAQPNVTQTMYYGSRSVPNQYNPDGSQNQVVPNTYGTLHNWTEAIDQALPTASSQITHRLQRIGNTLRTIVMVFRNNGTRANAETVMPTGIQLKIGDQTLFSEDSSLRRFLMWKRFGQDAADGILCYDWTHDFAQGAGWELGHDWIWSQDVVDFNFLATYPSGWSGTCSLTWLVDDLTVPAGVDLYNP